MSPRIRPALRATLAALALPLALSTLTALTGFAGVAHAQPAAWPTKPVKYVVPFSPGGVSDGVARLVPNTWASGWASR